MFGWLLKPKEEARPAATDSADRLIAEGNRAEDDGQLARACELYRQALALAPRYAKAHINLGIALEATGDALARSAATATRSLPIRPMRRRITTSASCCTFAANSCAQKSS